MSSFQQSLDTILEYNFPRQHFLLWMAEEIQLLSPSLSRQEAIWKAVCFLQIEEANKREYTDPPPEYSRLSDSRSSRNWTDRCEYTEHLAKEMVDLKYLRQKWEE